MTVGFSFDDNPRSIPKTDWPRPGHTTSGVVRTGERNHEMPGLPYAAFRMVNAQPGGGKPFPYDDKDAVDSRRLSLMRSA